MISCDNTTTTDSEDQDQDNLILDKVSIVECPYLSDIIFRQGTNVIHHPGNSWFRSLIQTKFEEGYGNITNDDSKGNGNGNGTILSDGNSTNTNPTTTTTTNSSITYKSKRTKPLTEELIKEIKRRNCRILIWNDKEFGWWSKFDNEQQIFNKIEYICRDFIFGSNKSHCINRRQVVTSVTTTSSVGLVNNKSNNKSNKSKENKEQIITQSFESSNHSNHHHPHHHPNHHRQRGGGTSIFSSLQQGSVSGDIMNMNCNKNSNSDSNSNSKRKRRLSSNAAYDSSHDNMDDDGCMGGGSCFGMSLS